MFGCSIARREPERSAFSREVEQCRARGVRYPKWNHQINAGVHQLLGRQFAQCSQAVDDLAHAGLVDVADLSGGKIDSLDQDARVDPLLTDVPALDAGRSQQVLTHVAALERDLTDSVLGECKALHGAHDPSDGLSRALALRLLHLFGLDMVRYEPRTHYRPTAARPYDTD